MAGAIRVDGLVPSWPIIVGLTAFGRALANPAALLYDPDTYLHIAAGRWMLAHSALPLQDPFSHSLAGTEWVPHEWLAEVVLATVYRADRRSGLVERGPRALARRWRSSPGFCCAIASRSPH